MNCRWIERLLSQQRDGELPAPDAPALFTHLRDCPACRRYREALRELGMDARQLHRPTPPLPGQLQIAERWLAERPVASRLPWALPRLSPHSLGWRAAGAAVVIVAVVGLQFGLAPPAPPQDASRLT